MQALITLTFDWVTEPSADLLYFIYINGEEHCLKDAKTQLFVWDKFPYKYEFEVTVIIEKRINSMFGKTGSQDLEDGSERFLRGLNSITRYTPKNLDFPTFFSVKEIECAVSQFQIPDWDPVLSKSPMFYQIVSHPDDPSQLSLYFRDFNHNQLKLSKEHDRKGALFLVISHITNYTPNDLEEESGLIVYYESKWIPF